MSGGQIEAAALLTAKAKCVLVDIEGTTSAIQFVYDVLFPYARRELATYLESNWQTRIVQDAALYLANDLGYENLDAWSNQRHSNPDKTLDLNSTSEKNSHLDSNSDVDHHSVGDPDSARDRLLDRKHRQLVETEVLRLMDADIKSTGLKALQGVIWAEGYAAGRLTSHVYPDVPVAFKAWNEAGIDIRIFSSGSVTAQKVFFRNTEYGDLGQLISNNYDTTTGAKREAQSYQIIADDIGTPTMNILFLSDVEQELDAAKKAGMQVALVVRPGNAPADREKFPTIDSFNQILLTKS